MSVFYFLLLTFRLPAQLGDVIVEPPTDQLHFDKICVFGVVDAVPLYRCSMRVPISKFLFAYLCLRGRYGAGNAFMTILFMNGRLNYVSLCFFTLGLTSVSSEPKDQLIVSSNVMSKTTFMDMARRALIRFTLKSSLDRGLDFLKAFQKHPFMVTHNSPSMRYLIGVMSTIEII